MPCKKQLEKKRRWHTKMLRSLTYRSKSLLCKKSSLRKPKPRITSMIWLCSSRLSKPRLNSRVEMPSTSSRCKLRKSMNYKRSLSTCRTSKLTT